VSGGRRRDNGGGHERGRDRSRGACRLTATSQSRTVLALNRSGVISPCDVLLAADLAICHITPDRPSTCLVNIQPKNNIIPFHIVFCFPHSGDQSVQCACLIARPVHPHTHTSAHSHSHARTHARTHTHTHTLSSRGGL